MHKLLLILLLLSSNSYSACLDTAYSTFEINHCLIVELKAEKQKLNDTLQQAYKTSPNIKKEIKQSQLAWLAYKQSHCGAVHDLNAGGSLWRIVVPACVLRLTKLRINELYADFAETH